MSESLLKTNPTLRALRRPDCVVRFGRQDRGFDVRVTAGMVCGTVLNPAAGAAACVCPLYMFVCVSPPPPLHLSSFPTSPPLHL